MEHVSNGNGTGGGARRWVPWATLFGTALWVYRDVVFGGAAFLGLDASLQQEGFAFFRRHLLRGEFPTWNPHVMCGAPVFGDAHSQLLYPPNLVLLFFGDTLRAWSFLSLGHFLVAGGGTYIFGRELGYSRAGALVSGLAFMLCEFVVSIVDEPVALHSVVWLPLLLWCTHRAFAGSAAHLVWSGVLTGVMLLSTMFQYGFCALLVTAAYGAYVSVTRDRRPATGDRTDIGRAPWRWVRVQGVIAAIGVGLFAVQLLPLIEAKGLSARNLMDVEAALGPPRESLSGWDILNMAFPWAAAGKASFASHAGFMVAALAVLAFFRRPPRAVWFFAGAGAFFLLLALGRHTPVYGLIHSLGLPGFSLFKDPNRMSYPVYLCLAMLAGAGTTALGGLGRVPGRLPAAALPVAAAAAVGLNLLWFAPAPRNLVETGALAALTTPDAVVRVVAADGGQGRVFSTIPPLNLSRPSLFGLHGADDWNSFAPLRYLQFTSGSTMVDPKAHTASTALLSSTNRSRIALARYALLAPAQAIPLALAPSFEPLLTTTAGVLYRDSGGIPRTFVAPSARSMPDAAAGLAFLDDPAFAPLREVLIETPAAPGPGGGEGTARVLSDSADRVEILAETGGDSWLVLLDSFHPGWRATVDGRPAEVLAADHAFRAVKLPAGRHRAVFAFHPAWFHAGAAISALTLAAVCAAFIVLRRRARGG